MIVPYRLNGERLSGITYGEPLSIYATNGRAPFVRAVLCQGLDVLGGFTRVIVLALYKKVIFNYACIMLYNAIHGCFKAVRAPKKISITVAFRLL